MSTTFRIGETNHYVKPGDFVWTDIKELLGVDSKHGPIIKDVPVSGTVRFDGTVLLTTGKIVELRQCRLCEKVIRL